MRVCMICGQKVRAGKKVCDHCLMGYWMGPKEADREVCHRCDGTHTYTRGGRVYQCEYCN